jgi:lyso-ornithine lipid O-acyltransferase
VQVSSASTPLASPVLAGAMAAPAAVSRTSRRTGKTALFLVDAGAHIKQRLLPLPDGPATTLRRQGYAAFMAGNLCGLNGFEVQVHGELPRGPAILVCNHITWQDPILIFSVAPALPVAKREVGGWPLVGDIARGLDVMLVDRSSPHSGASVLLRARTLLARGASVLTFPEGTTSYGDDILPFHRGMFGLAKLTGVPIVPIALRYHARDVAWVGDDGFFPSFLKTVARTRTVAELEFGSAILAEPDESAAALAERTRGHMRAMLRRLRKLS